jgi:hypothetical protein
LSGAVQEPCCQATGPDHLSTRSPRVAERSSEDLTLAGRYFPSRGPLPWR